jgi:hypothetical protein
MPVLKDCLELPDDRVLCARDAKSVVLKEEETRQICDETKQVMDKLFARFVNLPETNFTISLVDRVSLIALFKIPGHDYACPNTMGYISSKTNGSRMTHEISLMSGLLRSTLKSTFVHEMAHAWTAENLRQERKDNLSDDAAEGFCELMSYMVMDSLNDEEGKTEIELNAYTRGQIDLFIQAEKRVGFNEIVEWMKYGVDDCLKEDDPMRVRDLKIPVVTQPQTKAVETNVVATTQTNAVATATETNAAAATQLAHRTAPPVVPNTLTLNGITWSRKPLASINGRTFAPQELANVRVGTNTVNIRCVAIREDSVSILKVDTGEELELKLKPSTGK